MKSCKVIFFLCLTVFPILSFAEVFQSNGRHVSLLELYTSEGCSSCPPADRWLSEFKHDKRLWTELIPVAFHVDYWNYIGWTDRFASEIYSDRQRRYARGEGLSTVYTPGFLLNGREWRSFFGLRRLTLNPEQRAGDLTVTVTQPDIEAVYKPDGKSIHKPVLNIAILGFDLVTQVQAGENRDRELKHDFTVLGYKTVSMTPSENGYTIFTRLPELSISAPRLGLAVWVHDYGDLTPVQSAGGYLTQK